MSTNTIAVVAGIGTQLGVGYGLARHYGLPIKPLVLTVVGAGLAAIVVSFAVGLVLRAESGDVK